MSPSGQLTTALALLYESCMVRAVERSAANDEGETQTRKNTGETCHTAGSAITVASPATALLASHDAPPEPDTLDCAKPRCDCHAKYNCLEVSVPTLAGNGSRRVRRPSKNKPYRPREMGSVTVDPSGLVKRKGRRK